MQCSRHLFNRGFCFSYLPACPPCLPLNDKRKNNYKIYTLGLEFNRIVWSRVENIVVGALPYCFVVTESKLAHADNVQHLKSKQSAS